MIKRQFLIRNKWESLSNGSNRVIISRSVENIVNKKIPKWKVIVQTDSKPKIYRGFKTKKEAYKLIKGLF